MEISAHWFLQVAETKMLCTFIVRFIVIYFTNHAEAAPQAKVKKRKTLKQVLQEKEEKAKEKALKRLEDSKSIKEVRN